ncbi:hypothetical protein ACOME3_000070 [Neoechinorhynchus agilis]
MEIAIKKFEDEFKFGLKYGMEQNFNEDTHLVSIELFKSPQRLHGITSILTKMQTVGTDIHPKLVRLFTKIGSPKLIYFNEAQIFNLQGCVYLCQMRKQVWRYRLLPQSLPSDLREMLKITRSHLPSEFNDNIELDYIFAADISNLAISVPCAVSADTNKSHKIRLTFLQMAVFKALCENCIISEDNLVSVMGINRNVLKITIDSLLNSETPIAQKMTNKTEYLLNDKFCIENEVGSCQTADEVDLVGKDLSFDQDYFLGIARES